MNPIAQVREILFDVPPEVKYPEDGFWPFSSLVGVWDGVSAPYCPKNPQKFFLGRTGGQMISNAIFSALLETTASNFTSPALTVFATINERIRDYQIAQGLPLDDGSQLAGAVFTFAEIQNETTTIFHGGDCYAVWKMKSGESGITHNSFRPLEAELREKIAELMGQFGGDRAKMWDEFYPFLCEKRRENTNKPGKCALLNGQPELFDCWDVTELPTCDLASLLLFTDGMVPFPKTGDEAYLLERVLDKYETGGLHEILSWARRIDQGEAKTSHQTHAEATGIAIHFS